MSMRNLFRLVLIALALPGSMACGTAGMETGPDAVVTHDGLHKVDWGDFEHEFQKPGASLASYKKIMLDPMVVTYTKGHAPKVAVPQEDIERMRKYWREAVSAHLTRGGFEIASASGSDVLRVEASAINLELVPPRAPIGRSRTYTFNFDSVVIVANLRDSESGEILYRVAEPEAPSNSVEVSNSTDFRADMQEIFSQWAATLVRMLTKAQQH